ncbi:MAG: sulfurtransferase [Verrucomicrobiaceae bacterium]|nr:sulfurtransferase [Verrucomicrobiaceae bacterium]
MMIGGLFVSHITCSELLEWQRHKDFTLLDVRLRDVKANHPLSIAGSIWQDPELIETWMTSVPSDRPVVVFCAHGRSVSHSVATQLNESGLAAHYLEGGLAAWIEKGQIID